MKQTLIAVAVGLLMFVTAQTSAQTFTNLYNFTGGNDGANPVAGLILSGSTLYGTAQYGGTNGNGTVFKINTNGIGFSVLHTFTALDAATQTTNNDGANPSAGTVFVGQHPIRDSAVWWYQRQWHGVQGQHQRQRVRESIQLHGRE